MYIEYSVDKYCRNTISNELTQARSESCAGCSVHKGPPPVRGPLLTANMAKLLYIDNFLPNVISLVFIIV